MTKLTIRKSILHQNMLHIKEHLSHNTEVLAVVKANAYGFGLIEVAKVLEQQVCGFGIARPSEGIALRNSGITKPIILLSAITQDEIASCLKHDLQILIHNKESLEWLRNLDQNIKVNLKINTQFNRFGFTIDELKAVLADFPSNLEIMSTYSHPIEGEVLNSEMVKQQHQRFLEAIDLLKDAGIHPGKLHFCNSGCAEWFPEAHHDLVRLGRRLFMDAPTSQLRTGIVEPMTWTATVLTTRHLKKGESSGYNQGFITDKETNIAIINVGYGDGLILYKQSQAMPVQINGKRYPVVSVCMDSAVIDLGEDSFPSGTEVVLFGEGLSSQEVAAVIQDEGCSITTLISSRVPRVYID